MVESTFQLVPKLGPERERRLWRDGVTAWAQLPSLTASLAGLPTATFAALSATAATAQNAFDSRDIDTLAALFPSGEHWRLFGDFGDNAAYLDIETGDDVVGHAGISAIGIVDRQGPALWLGHHELASFVERSREWSMLITFNGLSYDVPILRQAFPQWTPPRCHIDLRHVLGRLGITGGLKSIERRLPSLHLKRPPHLDGLGGWDASSLYRRGREGDQRAMRCFAEYNLYDAVNLRTLMAYAYNRLIEAKVSVTPSLAKNTRTMDIPQRGDVLYDISKLLLAI